MNVEEEIMADEQKNYEELVTRASSYSRLE